jgi:transcriptional regulator with XRE-family HTH domain
LTQNDTKPGGRRVTPRQTKAIEALFSKKTMEQAASAAGVSRKTLYRWLNNDTDFQDALAAAESREIDSLTRRLIELQKRALDTFEKILDKPEAPGVWAMLRTAQAITDNMLRIRELRNVEARLIEIEARIYGQKVND